MTDQLLPVLEDFLTGFYRDPNPEIEDTEWRKQLFSALHRHFSSLQVAFELERKSLDMDYYPERPQIRLTPVKTAYPSPEKFDLAILNPGEAPREAGEDNRFGAYWQQPLAAAVNLHLCTDEALAVKYLRKLEGDLKKMNGYLEQGHPEFAGLTLLFLTNDAPQDDRLAEAELSVENGAHAWVVAENGLFKFQP